MKEILIKGKNLNKQGGSVWWKVFGSGLPVGDVSGEN